MLCLFVESCRKKCDRNKIIIIIVILVIIIVKSEEFGWSLRFLIYVCCLSKPNLPKVYASVSSSRAACCTRLDACTSGRVGVDPPTR